MKTHYFAFALAWVLLTTHGANASTIAYSFTNAPASTGQVDLGFIFDVLTPITVTSLGWFDVAGTGFNSSHQVAIYGDSNESVPVVSATVAAGTADPLTDGFRFVGITPTLLAPGLYTIVGNSGSDEWAYGSETGSITGFSVDPDISIAANASRYAYDGAVLEFPQQTVGYTVYAGPNFIESAASTPEPGGVALSGLGMLLIAAGSIRGRGKTPKQPHRPKESNP